MKWLELGGNFLTNLLLQFCTYKYFHSLVQSSCRDYHETSFIFCHGTVKYFLKLVQAQARNIS